MAELRKSPPLSLAFMTQTEQLLRFLSLVPYLSPLGKRPRRNQRRTKERPKNSESIEVRFIKIAFSFPSLILCLIPPTDDRETTERTPTKLPATQKCFLLRLTS